MSANGYRIIFMGTPDFAVPSLAALLESRHDVVGVVSQPDRPKGRGKKLTAPPVKQLAEKWQVPVLQPTTIKTDEFLEQLRAFKPDCIVVAAYGRILPKTILDLPPLGCINVHGSLLPRHRGAAPIQWTIIQGDREAGVTIMQMDEGMDTGDMLFSAALPVADDETAGTLFEKLAGLGARTLIETLEKLEKGSITPQQQDNSKATKAPPLRKEIGLVDWRLPAEKLHCLIRGIDPWPSAYSFLDDMRYRLFSPEVVGKKAQAPPGTIVLADKKGIEVATGSCLLRLREIQPEGKKRLSAEAFLCGHTIPTGSRFSSN